MNRNLRIFLSLLVAVSASRSGYAQCTFTSTAAGGRFSAASTWTVSDVGACDTIPTAASIIIINGPVVLDTDFTLDDNAATLTINPGGSLTEDGTPRTLILGTGSSSEQLDRAVVATNARLSVSELVLIKSELTVDSAGKVTVQCNLTIDNLGIVSTNGAVEIIGNLNLITGNALLQGNGTLLIVGCITGSNGALNAAIQGNLLVCVRNLPTTCGSGVCNGDVPLNNNANCVTILPPLPVELTWFKAGVGSGNTSVRLAWQTASEHNAREFIVERSATGRDFGAIGQVLAVGNSASVQDYSWHDERPLAGQCFYRLRQVDQDGTTTFSAVASVRATTTTAIMLWPTAAAGVYKVSAPGTVATLMVLTPTGSVVQTQALPEAGGQLSLRGCPRGLYLVRVVSTLGTTTTRIAHLGQ
ncbi:MAG: hypothetical protein H7330_17110 [Hymenobacteraceae bacterium]|nr:hypothetical protein [Hymenobacteraceae bacterium]